VEAMIVGFAEGLAVGLADGIEEGIRDGLKVGERITKTVMNGEAVGVLVSPRLASLINSAILITFV